jgi:proteasome lid subunit RPN8/RPN11
MTNAVRVPRTIVNEILHHAQQAAGEEICGLIAGRGGEFTRCYPVANVARDKQHLFQMDPKGQIDAMRAMRVAGEELMAIYHSHPDAPAAPSPTDVAQDEYPEVLYLIVSLTTKGVLEMRGFSIRDRKVMEVAIGI